MAVPVYGRVFAHQVADFQDNLAEAVIVEILCNDQRLREAHEHAFEFLKIVKAWLQAMSHRLE